MSVFSIQFGNLEKYFTGVSTTPFLEMNDKMSSSTLNSKNCHSKLSGPNRPWIYDGLFNA